MASLCRTYESRAAHLKIFRRTAAYMKPRQWLDGSYPLMPTLKLVLAHGTYLNVSAITKVL